MPEFVDQLPLVRTGRFDARGVEFTAIDVETTGFQPGHVVELAAVRVRADGTVLGELSTLVNPGPGVAAGPTHVHRIRRAELDEAPPFAQVLPHFLELARGSVLVAHNLPFELRFLAHELDLCGVSLSGVPGICTLRSARHALELPNHRLATVARSLGAPDFDAHTALGDARACAHVVAALVTRHGMRLHSQPQFPPLPKLAVTTALVPRREALPEVTQPWTASMSERVATPAASGPDPALEDAYVALLGDVLADHHLADDEAAALAGLAASAGLREADLHRVHTEFVRGMQTVAEADGILTQVEIAELQAVAEALGVLPIVAELKPFVRALRPKRVLVLGREADADELRAAVLASGVQLAKRLTASVTHLVVCPDVPSDEPRLARATDLGVPVLDLAEACAELDLPLQDKEEPAAPVETVADDAPTVVFAVVPAPAPPMPTSPMLTAPMPAPMAPQPVLVAARPDVVSLWGGRALLGAGLVLLLLAGIAEFGGAPVASGLIMFLVGLGVVAGGQILAQRGQP